IYGVGFRAADQVILSTNYDNFIRMIVHWKHNLLYGDKDIIMKSRAIRNSREGFQLCILADG
ncbi:MAG: hypothetical protein WCA39_09125, partial [Nitrososphaeraceae archaeon]